MRRLYADAAAATPLSRRARQELLRLLDLYGNAGALHYEGVEAKKELETARASVARSIGAHADEIVFTSSGTEGNNLAIQGVLRPLLHTYGGLHAITCAIEHQSVLEPLRALQREGLTLTEMEVDTEGLVSPKALAEAITDKTVFVSIQLMNSEVGTIEPLHDIARGIRKKRIGRSLPIYFHTDASQALLWVDTKVDTLGIDLMTLDAQKVLGPKGVGCLYVRRGSDIEPVLWGGAQERGLRGGTPNVPLIGSFALALADAQATVQKRAQKVSEIRDMCIKGVMERIPDAILNGPSTAHRAPNNVNVSIPGLEAQMAVIALDAEGIAASTRSACNIGEEEPSHVIEALGVPRELAGTAIRLTFLPDVSRGDARRVAETLEKVAHRYRNMA